MATARPLQQARFLRNPNIQTRIMELHKENLTKVGVTVESVFANIQHDRSKAREAGLWSVACQLDKLEGQYLSMFGIDNNAINQPDKQDLSDTPELREIARRYADEYARAMIRGESIKPVKDGQGAAEGG